MTVQIRKATRKKAKLRLGICAPSGAGKTYSSLLLAFGLGGKIGMIDTENGSGDLYANLGAYDIITLGPPYTAASYIDAIHAFEEQGYDVIIIDSLSHAWAGEGGLLDKQGKVADRTKNSYTAWREVTPDHNKLVNAMLQSSAHIIATMRTKIEYVLETNDKGKQTPKKVGMAPIQREGMEYEMTVVFDVDSAHVASASKDRTDMFKGEYFTLDQKIGKKLLAWLDSGVDEFEELKTALELATITKEDLGAAKAKANRLKPQMNAAQTMKIRELILAAEKNADEIETAAQSFKTAHQTIQEEQQ